MNRGRERLGGGGREDRASTFLLQVGDEQHADGRAERLAGSS